MAGQVQVTLRFVGRIECPHCGGEKLRPGDPRIRRPRHESWGTQHCVLALEMRKWGAPGLRRSFWQRSPAWCPGRGYRAVPALGMPETFCRHPPEPLRTGASTFPAPPWSACSGRIYANKPASASTVNASQSRQQASGRIVGMSDKYRSPVLTRSTQRLTSRISTLTPPARRCQPVSARTVPGPPPFPT
ncbi:MAG: transposase family protein [Acidobacteriaceae bacterium]|nr:transposase family protein [Acidobacteriaceae bacterium]